MGGWGLHKGVVDKSGFSEYRVPMDWGLNFLSVAPSWGTSLADGRTYVRTAPWLLFFPSSVMFRTVFSFNLLGDGLRDLLDPRMRNIQTDA